MNPFLSIYILNSIDLDETGALYVADFARDHRSSQVLKYEAVPLVDAAAVTAPATDSAIAEAPLEETEDALF